MTNEDNTKGIEQTNLTYRTTRPERPQPPLEAQEEQMPYSMPNDVQGVAICPRCGAAIDADADYCEVCHNYIREDVCSFCGSKVSVNAAFCPECGSPKVGIVCPVCRTMNEFAFCKQCGTPLTNEAKALVHELKQTSLYNELVDKAKELTDLDKVIPYTSAKDRERETAIENLRVRVLTLLAKDMGEEEPQIESRESKRMSSLELERRKAEISSKLAALFESISTKTETSPVRARNYAMACKPSGVRVAWKCNYKKAIHSSPCACAKPQLGGKWIILGRNFTEQTTD